MKPERRRSARPGERLLRRSGPLSWRVRLALFSLLLMAVATVWFTNRLLSDRFTETTRNRAELRLALYSGNVLSELRRNSIVPQLLARDPALIGALNSADYSQSTQRLISFVDAVAEAAKGDPSDLKPLNISVDSSPVSAAAGPVLLQTQPSGQRPGAIVRASGDRFVSVEYGDMKVDLTYRCQIELLDRAIADKRRTVKGLGITNPNLRSMSLQFDPSLISQEEVVSLLKDLDESLPSAKDIKLPTRQFTLPVTFEDPNIDLATKRYAESVRSKAAYLPSNKEYLRKANGMGSFEDVEDVAVGSTLLAVAVGFYLSTPILVVSPRFFISHELLSDSVKQP
uniref:carboxyltransferase domain-containing protein n=1 Tax=Marinovum algicola TaxID=42444 RepID=UPI0024BBD6D4